MLALLFAGLLLSCERPPSPPNPPESPPDQDEAQPELQSSAGAVPATEAKNLARLPFHFSAAGLLIDDLDADGAKDIVLHSHGGNTAIPYRQTAPRQFEAGPPIEFVGFHPNDIIRLPFDGEALYMVNAEGESQLRFFHFDEALNAVQDGALDINFPKYTLGYSWPEWGNSLVVTPYSGTNVTLFKQFDVATKEAAEKVELKVTTSPRFVPSLPVTADLDGDAVDELIFAVSKERIVKALIYAGVDAPPMERTLWEFPGGTPHMVAPIDLNADDKMDLLVVGNTLKALVVLINEGDFRFRETSYDLGDNIATDIDVAEAADGSRYVLVSTTFRIFLFEFPPGQSEPADTRSVENVFHGIVRGRLADLDADGHLDVVITRTREDASNAILYGPLKQNFEELSLDTLLIPKTLSEKEPANAQ